MSYTQQVTSAKYDIHTSKLSNINIIYNILMMPDRILDNSLVRKILLFQNCIPVIFHLTDPHTTFK